MKTNSEDLIALVVIGTFIVAVIGISMWWLPQKWEACTKMYDNLPAQVFCFIQK